jgi:hypothetical protein
MKRKTHQVKLGRGSGMPVIGVTTIPSFWWPKLPGKATPPGWNIGWSPTFEDGCWTWAPYGGSAKRVCGECKKASVKGIARYCDVCSKSRRRGQTRAAVSKHRSSVSKTGFSPIGAEALK